MRQFIVLVGNNGSGKTWYSNNCFPSTYKIVRPDDFHGDCESIQKQIFAEIESGLRNNQTVVLDGLNLEISFRKKLLYFPNKFNDCEKILLDFGPGNQGTLKRLINERPFKTASEWTDIHNINFKLYEKPSIDEGYDKIIII